MEVQSKLKLFQASPEKLSRYRKAVRELRDLGVDQVLMELSLPEPIGLQSKEAGNQAIAALYESLGYQSCLNALFSLDDLPTEPQKRPVADYGASERLGLSPEEEREFSK